MITSCVGTAPDDTPIDTTSITPHNLHTFTVTATDSVGNTSTTEVEYYVQAAPPVANPQSFSVAWGAAASLPVLGNVTVTDYPIDPTSVTVVSPPSDGTATANPDGTITFTDNPALTYANYVHTGNLDDSFSYEVSDLDGNVSNVTTVNLTVLPQLMTTSLPSVPEGLTLQQPQAQPVDSIGSSCGGPGVSLNGSELASCGGLAPVTIINDGTANTGWTLSGQISDFVDPSAAPETTCDIRELQRPLYTRGRPRMDTIGRGGFRTARFGIRGDAGPVDQCRPANLGEPAGAGGKSISGLGPMARRLSAGRFVDRSARSSRRTSSTVPGANKRLRGMVRLWGCAEPACPGFDRCIQRLGIPGDAHPHAHTVLK